MMAGIAEFTLCHRRRLYPLPETTLSWDALAAIPMSMWTAYGCIEETAHISRRTKGCSVLVHGGTSSVGLWAILLAKEQGAVVLATTRNPSKAQRLQAAGADHVVIEDKLEEDVQRLYPKGVDIIVELISPGQCTRTLGSNGSTWYCSRCWCTWRMGS